MSVQEKPIFAVGHLFLSVSDVKAVSEFLIKYGARRIVLRENLGILELRGGTHVVVRQGDTPDTDSPFDLMVEDVASLHAQFTGDGVEVTDVKHGKIHDGFKVKLPGGPWMEVNSSHASKHPV